MTQPSPASAGPEPSPPVRYLHGERPGGLHVWLPVTDVESLVRQAERLAPHVPADTVWDVTRNTYSPETAPPVEEAAPAVIAADIPEPEIAEPVVLEGQGVLPIETPEETRHDPT